MIVPYGENGRQSDSVKPFPFLLAELGVGHKGFQKSHDFVDLSFFDVNFEAGHGVVLVAGDDYFSFPINEHQVVARPFRSVMFNRVFERHQL